MLCRVMIVTNNLVISPMVTSNANLESFGLQVALPRKIVKEKLINLKRNFVPVAF